MSMEKKGFLTIFLIIIVLILVGYFTYLSIGKSNVKGAIKIESITPIPENKTIIVRVKNIGNVTVVSEKAYVTFPDGVKVSALISSIELKPGEATDLLVDVSSYLSLSISEPGNYVVELYFSHGAVDKANFKIP